MSSRERTRRILLSPSARQDFVDILRFTGETWGKEQLRIYRNKIDDALHLIARNPGMGHRAPELSGTHRLYFVGSHVIVYRDQEVSVAVVRILHQRMSLARHVSPT